MSQTLPIANAATSPVRAPARADAQAAIARAAQATGVDFSYLLAQAKIESALDPSAHAGTSSAAGLYQFTKGTWLNMLDRHGVEHGLDWAEAAIDKGRIADPALRSQVMALRYDPETSALMAAELASDNRAALSAQLGREPDHAELYLAHFLGAGGAGRFLSALQGDPTQSAAALLPDAAAANRAIFYDHGAPRSLGQVMDLIRAKVQGAMDGAPLPPLPGTGDWAAAAASPTAPLGPVAQEFRMAAQGAGQGPAPLPRASMAETLASTFGLGGANGGMPDHVRAAYGKLQALGL